MTSDRVERPVVVLTRSSADNAAFRARLEAAGAAVIERPMIEVRLPADGGAALDRAVRELGDRDWLVVTSVNAVEAVVAAVDGRPWPDGLRVAAVGPVTGRAAAAAGLTVSLIPEVATAEALAEAFPPPAAPGERVFVPVAELASDAVETGLRAKGYSVERVTAYRTAAPESADPNARSGRDIASPVAIAFFSPSAVSRYVDRFGPVPPVVVCIGPATSARAEALGLTGIVVAAPHDADGVLAALRSALALGP